MPIAPTVKAIRLEKGITIEELARSIGRDVSYVSRLETGKRRFNEDRIIDFARALGCDPREFFASTNPPSGAEVLKELFASSAGEKISPTEKAWLRRLWVPGTPTMDTYIHALAMLRSLSRSGK